MTYQIKLSTKNQGTIPVTLLKTLGLDPNSENTLIIYKDTNGNFVIKTSEQMLADVKGSLGKKLSIKVKNKLAKMTQEEILEAEKNAKNEYFQSKYTNKV